MKIPDRFFRYETNPEKTYHVWACIATDRSFAIHIWAEKSFDPNRSEWIGGIEQHASPRISNRPVDHDNCPFLYGKCCHDGSTEAFYSEYNRVEQAITSGKSSDIFPLIDHIFKERLEKLST